MMYNNIVIKREERKEMTIKDKLELMKQIEARNEARIKEYMNKLQVASEAR